MENIIRLFNPSDLPFGPLSNNAFHVMNIDGKSWSSVTNYVYANMMCNNVYKNIVAEQKTAKNVKEVAIDLYRKCIDENWAKGMREGLEAKFRDQDLRDRLIGTGSAFFRYESENILLGTTPTGEGQNLLGIELRRLRENIRRLPRMPLIEKRVKRDIRSMAPKPPPRPLIKKEHEEIFEETRRRIIERKRELEEIELRPSPISLSEELEAKSCCFYTNEDASLSICTDKECPRPSKGWRLSGRLDIENCSRDNCDNERRAIIFDAWTTYMLKQNFPQIPEDQIDNAKAQQFGKLSKEELKSLMDRVAKLYNLNKLNKKVKSEIRKIIQEVRIPPPPGEIDGIEISDVEVRDVTPIPEPIREGPPAFEGDAIELIVFTDNPYDPNFWLSPLYPHAFSDNNFWYPTLLHFIMAYVIEKVFKHSKTNAHNLVIQAQDIRTLALIYERVKEQSWIDLLAKYARISIDVKFKDKKLQDLLLRTGESKIEFADHTDPVLGVGRDGRGMDITGGYLMRLRDLIRLERGEEGMFREFINVAQLIDNNPDVIRWLDKRTDDDLRTSAILQRYVLSKLPKEQLNLT
jgi:predicted NAD-dependent protein-ADP-ribosyltransferase YbiA (DUF1768 family)